MNRYCLALDLKNDQDLINQYIEYHLDVWPEIIDSIKSSGILNMEIFHVENRLFMIMDVDENFSFEKKAEADKDNPKVLEWENLMWHYQQQLPNSKPGEKWRVMEKIFAI